VLVGRLVALAVVGIIWQMPGCERPLACTTFESAPIAMGRSYTHPIQRGLFFRFIAEAARGLDEGRQIWHITVGPEGSTDLVDYVWPVSPPINSTHHLFVGPGLDWTAADSVGMNPRSLRFVLGAQPLHEAETVYARITKQVVTGSAYDSTRLRELGEGELTVTLEDVVMEGPAIRSIRLQVESCVPG
jgi:hypothetical protein